MEKTPLFPFNLTVRLHQVHSGTSGISVFPYMDWLFVVPSKDKAEQGVMVRPDFTEVFRSAWTNQPNPHFKQSDILEPGLYLGQGLPSLGQVHQVGWASGALMQSHGLGSWKSSWTNDINDSGGHPCLPEDEIVTGMVPRPL